ncbi:Hypothetical protein NTJ_12468 [Nesidiocoris tenuis]|uniref:Uncharacterized protein n=1 Tax=Nesidiocoris tenuis TaxID=355587 RepID=A0ABN7B5G6_9HEMI|nr:Hypothetical protein NTJ_12468 [Nesidiocoris tenuis]
MGQLDGGSNIWGTKKRAAAEGVRKMAISPDRAGEGAAAGGKSVACLEKSISPVVTELSPSSQPPSLLPSNGPADFTSDDWPPSPIGRV